ncbi:uncharacterized protein METZ01_LOCUS163751 [marine metagenome]|uniref:Uncharacterized protein n=1 Tax=marine metagenome TaxID=408172 RepID=A0A382BCF7_9ZZZZ
MKTHIELKNNYGGVFELNTDQIIEHVQTFLSAN